MAISLAFVSVMTSLSGPIKTNSFTQILGMLGICVLFPHSLYAATSEQSSTPVEFKQTDKEARNSLAYRSMMFDYHNGKHFEAATQILAQEKTGGYGPMQHNSQQLLLDLYLDIGMTNKVKDSLQDPANIKDEIKGHRAQLRLSLAELYYQQSNMEAMFEVLMLPSTHFTAGQIDKKNYLLGLYYLDKKNHAHAYKHLNKVSKSSSLFPYAHFNKTIVLIKNLNLASAKKELQKLLSHKAESEESMIFRDRVSLTLGELYLQNKQTKKAQEAFREVRLNSPYAAPALLGLGWSHSTGENIKAALSPWLELNNKNTSDPSFQHRLLLISRQYEALGASKNALNTYNHARRVYINELKEIKATRQIIYSDHWLKRLPKNITISSASAPLIKSNDIHTQLAASNIVVKTAGANRLFHRYASKDFHHYLKQYIQLQALGNYLSLWREQLPIYSEMIHDYQAQQKTLHQRVNQTLAQLADMNKDEAIAVLKNQFPESDHQWLSLLTPEERRLLSSLHAIKNRLKNSAPSLAHSEEQDNLRARIALLKNNLYWKISRDAPLRQEKLKRAMKHLEHEKQKLRENQQKIRNADRIMRRKLEPHQAHIHELIGRIDKTHIEIERINIKQKKRLQDIATQALDKQQKQLNNFLAIAELSIARMHESAALKKGSR